MKLNCIFDSRSYDSKPPKEDFGAISSRTLGQPCQQLTIDEFLDNVGSGKTYIAGDFIDRSNGRSKDNIKDINFFSVDIDNKEGEVYTNYTPGQVIKAAEKALGIKPLAGYETFSKRNSDGSQRFRLIYGIEESLDGKSLEVALGYLVQETGDMIDGACKDASRLFLGTCNKTWRYDDYELLSINKIDQILEADKQKKLEEQREREARKAERAKSLSSDYSGDDVIEKLKSIDLGEHLSNLGYLVKPYKDGYKLPCPIHNGQKDNFHINQLSDGVWVWHCFSECKIGGSIIDLHCELNNVDVGTAIAELCRMYGIERRRPQKGPQATKSIYEVERYISKDKAAKEGILESLKNNRKILLTGAMGVGKTHFVSNEIYSYAKELGKTLVMVIPGVKQLNNLEKNKGIYVVCDGLSYNPEYDRVATTPESLPKVIKELHEGGFILVVDESHERYTSLYRDGYKDKNVEKAEKFAYRTLHITATPRPLLPDSFNEIIEVKTRTTILNNVIISKVSKENYEDNLFSVARALVKAKKTVVLFNNDKTENGMFAEILEVKRDVVKTVYKEGQLNLLEEDPGKQVVETEVLRSVETVQSGKKSDNIESGQVIADFTCTTSAVMAGIDLYAKGSAALVVNTKGMYFDNLIQLIGRFREGIDVYLVVPDDIEPKQYFDLEDRFDYALRYHGDMAEVANRYNIDRLHDSGVKKEAYLAKDTSGEWVVDESLLAENIYKKWSEAVFSDTKRLQQLLKEQTAFQVKQMMVLKHEDSLETAIRDYKEAEKEEKKKALEEASQKLLELDDDTLSDILSKDFFKVDDTELEDVAVKYFAVADRHIEKINYVAKELFTDEEGISNKVKAFRHFYNSKSFAAIEREIKAKHAREINRLIKDQGTAFYLDKRIGKFKTATDVLQAKIRHELSDLEKKQGRISNKIHDKLTKKLIDEGYIYNKDVKAYKAQEADQETKKKALEAVGKTVKELLGDIYNFSSDGERISSIKY